MGELWVFLHFNFSFCSGSSTQKMPKIHLIANSYFSAYENGISSKDGTNFFEYDIALILIKGSSFDEKFNHQIGTVIKPICLIGSKNSKINEINELSLDQEITIVGMGWVKDKKKYGEEAHPLKLQYTKVKKIPVKKCFQEVYPRLGKKSKFPKDFLGIHITIYWAH